MDNFKNKNTKKISNKNNKIKPIKKNNSKTENDIEIRRLWGKKSISTLEPNYNLPDGPVYGKFFGETATSFFLEFFEGFVDKLVYQTNCIVHKEENL